MSGLLHDVALGGAAGGGRGGHAGPQAVAGEDIRVLADVFYMALDDERDTLRGQPRMTRRAPAAHAAEDGGLVVVEVRQPGAQRAHRAGMLVVAIRHADDRAGPLLVGLAGANRHSHTVGVEDEIGTVEG